MENIILYAVSEYMNDNIDTADNTPLSVVPVNCLVANIMRPAISAIMGMVGPILDIINAKDDGDVDEEERDKFYRTIASDLDRKINDILIAHVHKMNFIYGGADYSVITTANRINDHGPETFQGKYGFNNFTITMHTGNSVVKVLELFFEEKGYKSDADFFISSEHSSDLDRDDIISCCYPNLDLYTAEWLKCQFVADKYFKEIIESDNTLTGKVMDDDITKLNSRIAIKAIVYIIQTYRRLTGHSMYDTSTLCDALMIEMTKMGSPIQAIFNLCGIMNNYVKTNGMSAVFDQLYNNIFPEEQDMSIDVRKKVSLAYSALTETVDSKENPDIDAAIGFLGEILND